MIGEGAEDAVAAVQATLGTCGNFVLLILLFWYVHNAFHTRPIACYYYSSLNSGLYICTAGI